MQGGRPRSADMGRNDARAQGRKGQLTVDHVASLRRCAFASHLRHCVIASFLLSAPLHAQITRDEFSARRDSLAARIGTGVVVAFGGRKPVSDFGPFYQIPAFHYLTGYEYADAALI